MDHVHAHAHGHGHGHGMDGMPCHAHGLSKTKDYGKIILDYSLLHQNLGVAFFQFARSLFKIFEQTFSRIIFSSSPYIPENLVEFFRVGLLGLAKLDHLACNKFSKLQLSLDFNTIGIAVKQESYLLEAITCQMR